MEMQEQYKSLESQLNLWYKGYAKEEKPSMLMYTIEHTGRNYKVAERLGNALKELGKSYTFILQGSNKVSLKIMK